MQVVHTAGVPPNQGNTHLLITGWTWKIRKAPNRIVAANHPTPGPPPALRSRSTVFAAWGRSDNEVSVAIGRSKQGTVSAPCVGAQHRWGIETTRNPSSQSTALTVAEVAKTFGNQARPKLLASSAT